MFNKLRKKINNKFIAGFIYLIIILFSLYFININFNKQKEFQKISEINKEIKKVESIKNLNNKDTDGDGIEDWQENLYGTDIELMDTDKDGFSDFFEINNKRDPLVYGPGKKENVSKVYVLSSGIEDIQRQKDDFNIYKKKIAIEEKRKFELFLKEKQKKISKKEIEELTFFKKENNKIVKSLNSMADVLLKNDSLLKPNGKNDFETLFSVITDNKKKKKLDEKQLTYFYKVSSINNNISIDLNKIKISNLDISDFRDKLSNDYSSMADNLKIILEKYEKGEKDNVDNIKKYSEAVSDMVMTRQYMHLFIDGEKIKFSASDLGKIFYYSL